LLAAGLALLPCTAAALPDIDDALRTGAKAPHDAAVVVGIEDYTHIAGVPYATRDAQAFYRTLVYTLGVPASRVRLLDQGASHEMIREALAEAGAQADHLGTLWFYFAGHGAASTANGERMILGQDVRPDLATFESRGLRLAELEDIASAGGAQVVMVLDTCYTGRDRRGDSLVEGGRFVVPAYASEPRPRSAAWTAAGPNEVARPLDSVGHGAFTYYVVGALRGWADGQLDGQRDGRVTLEEASLYVADALAASQVGNQHPSLEASESQRWTLSASSKLESPPEIDATLETRPAPVRVDGPDYLRALEAQAQAEQRLAQERGRLEGLHQEAVASRAAVVRAEARDEWLRVQGIANMGGEAGAQALRTFIERWDEYSEEVDGVVEPIAIPQVDDARNHLRDLTRQRAVAGHGLTSPLRRLDDGSYSDASGVVLRPRDLGPLVETVSPECALVEKRRRRQAVGWGLVGGGLGVMVLGFMPLAVDNDTGEALFSASDTWRALGYTGIYGGLGAMSVGYTMNKVGYDRGAFLECAQQAVGSGGAEE